MTEVRPLRAYAEVALGRQRSPQHETGPFLVPYLRAANVKDGFLDLSDVKEMNFDPDEQATFSLRPGDVLVTEGSGSLSSVGASAVWNAEMGGNVCFQNTLLRLRPRPSTDARYLAWWCRHAFADGLFASVATGANIFHVSADRVRSLLMTYQPRAHQRAIAVFLDVETARIDALVRNKRTLLTLLEERKASTMLDGVSGHLLPGHAFVDSKLSWLTDRPAPWDEVLLRLVARTGSGHTPSREHPEWWNDCAIPWITTGEVAQVRSDEVEVIDETREMISERGVANSAGTVVLCRTASAGYSGIMGSAMATSQDFITWTCGALLRPRFLLLCLRAMRQDLLGRLATGSTHKTIYMPDLHALRIPLPPIGEQDQIVDGVWAKLSAGFLLARQLKAQIALLQERRQALITAAVTGELEIPGVAA
jgi:type I restriction enzyme S subunit